MQKSPRRPSPDNFPSFYKAVRNSPECFMADPEEASTDRVLDLVANAIDVFLVDPTANHIKISCDQHTITVIDKGGAFPFGQPSPNHFSRTLIEYYLKEPSYFSQPHQHTPHVQFRSRDGLALANIASLNLSIECCDGSQTWQQTSVLGHPNPPDNCKPTPNQERYSKVTLTLDPDVLPHPINTALLHECLFEASHLYPGLTLEFEDECYYQPQGLKALASYMATSITPHTPQFYYHQRDPDQDIDVQLAAVGYTQADTKFKVWVDGLLCFELDHNHGELLRVLQQANCHAEIVCVHLIHYKPRTGSKQRPGMSFHNFPYAPQEQTDLAELVLQVLNTAPNTFS